jgi:hypothetical protein
VTAANHEVHIRFDVGFARGAVRNHRAE